MAQFENLLVVLFLSGTNLGLSTCINGGWRSSTCVGSNLRWKLHAWIQFRLSLSIYICLKQKYKIFVFM